jgi:hypothetical protein
MLFASAVPLVPGKAERYRNLGEELEPHLDEYEGLNARYEVAGHAFWINHARNGTDLGVSVYDIAPAGLAEMGMRRWDTASAYDRWWLEFVGDVNGFDLASEPAHAAPPKQVFAWERPG